MAEPVSEIYADALGWSTQGEDGEAAFIFNWDPADPDESPLLHDMYTFTWDGDFDHQVDVSVGGYGEPVFYQFFLDPESFTVYGTNPKRLLREFEIQSMRWYALDHKRLHKSGTEEIS